jgi:DNA (cytosine-5)-methyltransferase 3A
MNVLSLFDGMSCGQIALNRLGIKYDKYFASEIDEYAIKVTQHNYPETIQIGDVLNVRGSDLPQIDLMFGGSPCQGFSFAGKRLNFDDPRSKLFFEFVRLRDELKPKYFLLENVKMKKEHEDVITEHMGVKPIRINSKLVSAQSRERLYWTNIPGIEQPEDKGILVKDIIDYITKHKPLTEKGIKSQLYYAKNYKATGKAPTLTRELAHGWGKNITPKCYVEIKAITGEDRLFSPLECERLQTVPDNYSSIVSNTQRFNLLGNGWTVDVIAHIFNSQIMSNTANPIIKDKKSNEEAK